MAEGEKVVKMHHLDLGTTSTSASFALVWLTRL